MMAAVRQSETSEVAQRSDAIRAIALSRVSHRSKQEGRSGCTPKRPEDSASTDGEIIGYSRVIRNVCGAISTVEKVRHGRPQPSA